MTHAAPDTWTLPWRGLGLSSNLSTADVPQPYRLLDESPGLFDYVEYSASRWTRSSSCTLPAAW